jgi:predicted lipid-binding transport protein (Tim44 family)
MAEESEREGACAAMRRINQAWLEGRVDVLRPLVDPEIVMVFPGFAGRIRGREDVLAGFCDFCQNARIHEFREHDQQVDVVGVMAVVSFRYEMVYERSGERFRSTGRDLWVFQNQGRRWMAVWRTMLDIEENAAE